MPPVLSLLLWMATLLFGLACLRRVVLHVAFRTPLRKDVDRWLLNDGRAPTLAAAVVAASLFAASIGYLAFSLYAIRRCEVHDDCSLAPAWVGEGLHELQAMDGGCVYLPQGCGDGGAR